MTHHSDHAAQRLCTERNRYFTGKYMTARDFSAEQNYFLTHHQWHNWTLHGWGIVWGLQVTLDVERECLRIEPGMAIDCHGRELVLPYAIQCSVGDMLKTNEQPCEAAIPDVLIGLRFATIKRDPVPVLLDDCAPNSNTPHKDTHNRIQEFAKLCCQDFKEECWTYPPSHLPAEMPRPVPHREQDRPEGYSGDTLTLLEHNHPDECGCSQPPVKLVPPCECGACGFVPIARLTKSGNWHTDDLGCRYVRSPFYAEALTHVVGINWQHGGKTPFDELHRAFPEPQAPEQSHPYAARMYSQCNGNMGRIIVTFDRALALPVKHASIDYQHAPDDFVGNSHYLAQLVRLDYVVLGNRFDDHDLDGDDPPTPLAPKVVHLSDDRRQLFCDFAAHKIHRDLPVRIRLFLHCDLLLDDRGRAVDGDHLGGHVPCLDSATENKDGRGGRSGNGIEGGVFHSWTKLMPEGQR